MAALFTVLVLHRLRLGGLAVMAAFGVAVWLFGGFAWPPFTAAGKLALIGLLIAPLLGLMVDFMVRGSLLWRTALTLLAGAAALWIYAPSLSRLGMPQALLHGAAAALLAAWLVAWNEQLTGKPLRTGMAALALAGGTAACALATGATLYGHYAASIATGAAAFVLWLLVTDKKWHAGAVLRLPVAVVCGLLLIGAVLGYGLAWPTAAVLALVPMAVRLPVPERYALWTQALVLALYTGSVLAAALYSLSQPWRALY